MIEEVISLKNGIHLNVRYGTEKKPTVLFLHFSAGTTQMWNGVLPYFNNYRVIAPDLRGHGKSDKPETGYHIDDMAEDCFLLLNALGVSQCHIIGSSLGAEVAVSLAALHPEKVLSLVCEGALHSEYGEFGLINTPNIDIELEKNKKLSRIREKVLPIIKTREEILSIEVEKIKKQCLWNKYFAQFVESTILETKEGGFTYHYPRRILPEYMENYLNLQFEKYYKKIKCPVLFLPSEDESNNPRIVETMQAFSQLLSTCEIAHIKGSIHAYVWMQFPEICASIACNFLKKLNL